MDPLKTGIIGFGRMAEGHHLEKMWECDLYDVVGVCDVTPSRCEKAEELGLRATQDLETFLSWDIEAVVLAMHSSGRVEPALAAAAAGKHILSDKPLAANAADARRIVDAAAGAGTILSVYHNRRYDTDYRMVKSAVRDGLLGDIVFAENRTLSSRPAHGFGTPDYNPDWRITAAQGGGALLDFGPHWIDQVLDLMEGHAVVQVWGDVRNIKWGDADDHFRIEMVFDNGTRASAGKTDIAYGRLPLKWLIVGTEATLRSAGGGDESVTVYGPDFEIKRSRAVPEQALHANFARHVRGEEELIVSAAHALRVMEIISAGIESSETGKSLDVAI